MWDCNNILKSLHVIWSTIQFVIKWHKHVRRTWLRSDMCCCIFLFLCLSYIFVLQCVYCLLKRGLCKIFDKYHVCQNRVAKPRPRDELEYYSVGDSQLVPDDVDCGIGDEKGDGEIMISELVSGLWRVVSAARTFQLDLLLLHGNTTQVIQQYHSVMQLLQTQLHSNTTQQGEWWFGQAPKEFWFLRDVFPLVSPPYHSKKITHCGVHEVWTVYYLELTIYICSIFGGARGLTTLLTTAGYNDSGDGAQLGCWFIVNFSRYSWLSFCWCTLTVGLLTIVDYCSVGAQLGCWQIVSHLPALPLP